ncbi:hypothetical protein [Planctomyces sp. SH-PL14]|uniref:hypothetical protein n=1 Tax=Planctomyces sp. SH-PL14 TaxID=1632864 RepID=UPI00078BA747|nr:hypothetical protein [Planctomyces sp. SH-PL14]AMV19663.1 hypothetical protein VT03_17335 [Planctomyces sp. SH-PL14]
MSGDTTPDPRPNPVPSPFDPPSPSPPGFWRWVYNHNPFYVISTLLMLYAVRAAYGVMSIGEIDSWALLGVMGAYTLVLATIGVLIVRWGKVWEDARSIVLLLLLLFLAVSVSADDLFTREASKAAGIRMLAAGYLFSALVTEAVLIGTRLRLSWLYRVPLHLFLLFFYAAPYVASPEIQGWLAEDLNWVVFLFPNVAALLFLTLLPAVRRGPDLVARNGTPWRWPLYPWSAFVMIAFAVLFRSYVFALTFSQTGKIWIELPSRGMDRSVHAIALDTIWGPYFLVPMLLALLLLMFEASLVTGNLSLTRRTLWLAPLLILLAMIPAGGRVYSDFYHVVEQRIGPPVWLTGLFVALFYGFAWLRGIAGARFGVLALLALYVFAGPPASIARFYELSRPVAIGLATLQLTWEAWRLRSSGLGFLAAVVGSILLVSFLPDPLRARYGAILAFHLIWMSMVVLGLVGRDPFAETLRVFGAGLFPLAALLAIQSTRADFVPWFLRGGYVLLIAAVCLEIARRTGSRSYAWGTGGIGLVGIYAILARGYWMMVAAIGAPAATATVWSLGTLLAGTLISTHKAGWLTRGRGLRPKVEG